MNAFFFGVVLGMVMPRLIPVSMYNAKGIMQSWYEEERLSAKHTLQDERLEDLERGMRMYNVRECKSLKALAIVHSEEVKTIALVERLNTNMLHLWHIGCKDNGSGTLFIKTLSQVTNFSYDSRLHPRYKIALDYFR